jgi:hypothetical protein
MYEAHGHTRNRQRSATHYAWTNMIQRCTNPNRHDYKSYGGRGIQVCQKWRDSFSAFLADVGERPSADHSLDRYPNMNGNYEPGNVRWATKHQQMQNTRGTTLITFRGETHGLNEWARRLGMTHSSIQGRLQRGWSLEKTLTQPKRKEVRRAHN